MCGRIDDLVNNAVCFPRAAMALTDENFYHQVFDVHVKGAFYCSKFVVESMIRSGVGGSIVRMGSTHGSDGNPDLAAYAGAKWAMHTLSKHISRNYAQYGIRSNWVTVRWVATEGEGGYLCRKD